jgi:hypothetical protein
MSRRFLLLGDLVGILCRQRFDCLERLELMEAIWVAAEMRAGGAYAHTAISLTAMDEAESPHSA